MIKSPANVPALQAKKPTKHVPVRTPGSGSNAKKTNKVENQAGLLTEGMKGDREVTEGRQKSETSQRERRTKSREEMLGVPARRQLPNHSV